MNFRIADTFTASLGRLTGDEEKAVKTTAFDPQLNPANPGVSVHKLDRTRDKNFWSPSLSDSRSELRDVESVSRASLVKRAAATAAAWARTCG